MKWALLLMLAACSGTATADAPTLRAPPPSAGQAVAIFAGGCFWCMEPPFDKVPGVIATLSGYTGGPEIGPSYTQVANHQTGHIEALQVTYDPATVDYHTLLDVFWRNVDPTQDDGQFCDKGKPYRSAIFVSDPIRAAEANASKQAVAQQLGKTIVTEIRPIAPFWIAEAYHQDFYQKNPRRYRSYRAGCRRDARLRQIWGE